MEVYKSLMHRFILFLFFLKFLTNAEYWSVVDLLRRNPYWWPPLISSAYGISLHSRMLDDILYVGDKSDMPL